MRMDRGFRAVLIPIYPMGYQAPATDRTTQRGILNIRPEEIQVSALDISPFPESLSLQAELVSIPFVNAATVTVRIDATAYPPVAIYQEHTKAFAHQAVRLIYQGRGTAYWRHHTNPAVFQGLHIGELGLELHEGLLLLEKRFLSFQQEGLTLHRVNLSRQRFRMTPPGEENVFPLWPYGGYFKQGCVISEIQQTVFMPSLVTLSRRTHIEVTPSILNSWRDRPLMFGNQRVMMLADFQEWHQRSLAGDIEAGEIRITLSLGHDEKGQPYQQTYQSCRYSQPDAATGRLEIFFIKEE